MGTNKTILDERATGKPLLKILDVLKRYSALFIISNFILIKFLI